MSDVLFYFSMGSFIFGILLTIEIILGNHSIKALDKLNNSPDFTYPKVSIVTACRNEAQDIEEAMKSLLNLDYPNYEILAVNDRSTDETFSILQKIKQSHPHLKVVNIETLPAGWLGKNYALYKGAETSNSEYLLFTDADIVMEKDVLKKAAEYAVTNNIDHLTLSADIKMPNIILNMFTGAFIVFFSIFAKPWKAKSINPKYFVGIGAFNFVRRTAYFKAGSHEKIRMRPDDDLKLGKIMKLAGFRQELLYGRNMIKVNWYRSIKQLVKGMEKNAFSGLDYNLPVAIGSGFSLFLFFIFPYLAVFFTSGLTQLFFIGIILILLLIYADSAYHQNLNILYAFGFPAATILFIFIVWRTAFVTLKNKGIYWRDTFYTLKDLKENKV
jgi:glycosyltransferase involved in cell wall biosynthesis